MPRDFFPRKDLLAVDWSRNFRDRLVSDPAAYHFTPAQAANYAQLHDDFAAKLQIRLNPGTATKPATAAKNDARKALEKLMRSMAGQIRARKDISLTAKIAVGIMERKTKQTRTPRPDKAPGIRVLGVVGHAVTIQLTDEPTGRFGKPDGVTGASVFYHVGENPPAARGKWSFARQSSRARLTVTIPASVPSGAKVWFTAIWWNRRGESGPHATPVVAYMSYAPSIQLRLRAA
jgi:hypothetical protein